MIVAMIAVWAVETDGPFMGIVGIGLAAWLFMGIMSELAGRIRLLQGSLSESLSRLRRTPRAAWGMTLAHLGLAITIAGMTGAGAWKVESIQAMKPGDKVEVEIPGIGVFLVNSSINRDYTMVVGLVILYSVMLLTLNLAVDVVYGLLDKRVKYG